MAISKEELQALYHKYIQNQCTVEELQTLTDALGEDSPAFPEDLVNELFDGTWDGLDVFPGKYQLRELALPWKKEEPAPVIVLSFRKRWLRIAIAAAILLLGTGTYMWMTRAPKPGLTAKALKNDVQPGGNKAVLTLANGSTIILDSARNGSLAQQGNATVIKQNDGQLAYNTLNEKPTEVLYNTLSTPRGGQYQLALPDGSKVWLNAASSIRYPTAFTGKQRSVEITGEAYFEIAKNADMPFIVKMLSAAGDKGEVRVLGTRFDVNAYNDEETVRTTLVEGSVSVEKDAARALLKPGQQARMTLSGKMDVLDNADVEEVLAWKNGRLLLKHADMATILRQAARWYDVDVVYKDRIEGDTYTVSIPRNVPLSQVTRVLETMSGAHFTIDGKVITVSK
jgi:ferric-dicitrate binding protein FerR (iron transport regulator)